MPSRDGAAEGTVAPLLDAVFGLLVWMAHLLVIYVATALACGLGLVARGGRGAGGLVTVLVVATVIASAAVGMHGLRRWRRLGGRPERSFRMALVLGCDAIAAVAILWQLFAIGAVPPCR